MRLYKIIALFIHLLSAVSFTLVLLTLFRLPSTAPRYRKMVTWWHQRTCKLLNIERSIMGKAETNTTLYVANHVSWMDIPILASIIDPYFLSKAEVRSWPLVGWIGEKAGTLFIKRGSRSAAHTAHNEISNCLKGNKSTAGKSVLFFPEGKTANGLDILRFRPRLFDTAISTQTPIQPIVIYYSHPQYRINPKVPFIGKQSFMSNMWTLLGEQQIKVEVHFLEKIDTKTFKRNDLATLSEERVRTHLMSLMQDKNNP